MTDVGQAVDEDNEVPDDGEGFDGDVSRSMAKILIGNVGMMGLSVFTGVIVARTLMPEGRGEVAAVLGLVLFISLAGSLGRWTGLSRVEALRPADGAQVVGAGLLGVALLGTLTIGVAQLLLPLLFWEQSDQLISAARWLVLLIIPVMLFESSGDLLIGRQRFGRVSLDRLLRPLYHAVSIGVLWSIDQVTVTSVVVATGMSYLLVGVVTYGSLIKQSGISMPSREISREAGHFGRRIYIGLLSQKSNHELDLMLMPALVSPEVIGIYVVAVSAAAVISGGFSHLRQLVFGIVSRDESGDRVEIIEFTGRVTVFGAALLAVVLFFASPFLVNLVYGAEFDGSVLVIRLLLPGVVALVTSEVLFGALASMNKPLWATSASMMSLVVTVVGIATLVKPFGAEGAAVTSTVAYITMLVAALRYARRLGVRPGRLVSIGRLKSDVSTIVDGLKGHADDREANPAATADSSSS